MPEKGSVGEIVCDATGGGGGGGGIEAAEAVLIRLWEIGGGGGGTSAAGRAKACEEASRVSSSLCVRGEGWEAGMVSCEWQLAAGWEGAAESMLGADEGTAEVWEEISKIWASWQGHGLTKELHLGQGPFGIAGVVVGWRIVGSRR